MARFYRITCPSAAHAQALTSLLNLEDGQATWLVNPKGKVEVLAQASSELVRDACVALSFGTV